MNLPYQDPFLVAERLAFLDHLTHGRLEYGFGGGGLPTDKALFELPADEATPRTNEALDIIEQLLTATGPLTYEADTGSCTIVSCRFARTKRTRRLPSPG